jgi:hypothetical protein
MLNPTELKEVKRLASFAVSAHNTQPARWIIQGNTLILTDDQSRHLKYADTTKRDHFLSIGTSFEAMKLALSQFGFGLNLLEENWEPSVKIVCELIRVDKKDRLSEYLETRRSIRSKFRKATKEEKKSLELFASSSPYIQAIWDKKTITEIADDFNKANYFFLSNEDYLQELYTWLRFDKKDQKFVQDGLNPEAMHLSPVEAWGAKYILKPNVFQKLKSLNLAKLTIDEKSKVESATAILFLVVPKDYSPLQQGSVFLRQWLSLESIDFSMNPLSCLVDQAEYNKKWHSKLGLTSDQVLLNAFRVGPKPLKQPRSFRLPVEEVFRESYE